MSPKDQEILGSFLSQTAQKEEAGLEERQKQESTIRRIFAAEAKRQRQEIEKRREKERKTLDALKAISSTQAKKTTELIQSPTNPDLTELPNTLLPETLRRRKLKEVAIGETVSAEPTAMFADSSGRLWIYPEVHCCSKKHNEMLRLTRAEAGFFVDLSDLRLMWRWPRGTSTSETYLRHGYLPVLKITGYAKIEEEDAL